jgi:hypothetical protein
MRMSGLFGAQAASLYSHSVPEAHRRPSNSNGEPIRDQSTTTTMSHSEGRGLAVFTDTWGALVASIGVGDSGSSQATHSIRRWSRKAGSLDRRFVFTRRRSRDGCLCQASAVAAAFTVSTGLTLGSESARGAANHGVSDGNASARGEPKHEKAGSLRALANCFGCFACFGRWGLARSHLLAGLGLTSMPVRGSGWACPGARRRCGRSSQCQWGVAAVDLPRPTELY